MKRMILLLGIGLIGMEVKSQDGVVLKNEDRAAEVKKAIEVEGE